MFGRWIILLLVLFVLSIGAVVFAFEETGFSEAVFAEVQQECQDYLRAQEENWLREDDAYYRLNCDDENESSLLSLLLDRRNDMYELWVNAIVLPISILTAIFLSFLARWVITSREKI